MARDNPTNSDDMIDSRNVIARIGELEDEIEGAEDTAKANVTHDGGEESDNPWSSPDGSLHATEADAQDAALVAVGRGMADEYEELAILRSLADEGENFDDWSHGIALIRDSYFEDYARQLAEDIGAIKRDMEWPCNCIDWEKAASELQVDYSTIDFDGVTYWVRS